MPSELCMRWVSISLGGSTRCEAVNERRHVPQLARVFYVRDGKRLIVHVINLLLAFY